MSTIYEEAVADAAKLRQLALQNAQNAVIDRVTPKLREMIDQQLLREDKRDDDSPVPVKDDTDDILLDLAGGEPMAPDAGSVELDAPGSDPAAISLPDEEGKVTIDLDSFVVPEEGEVAGVQGVALGGGVEEQLPYEDEEMYLSVESARLLKGLLGSKLTTEATLRDRANDLLHEAKALKSSKHYDPAEIAKTLQKVEHTYWCVREACDIGSRARAILKDRLETIYEALESIQENKDTMIRRRKLNEDDLKVTIAGLPDEVEADEVSVDVVDAEDDEDAAADDGLGDLDDLGDMGDMEEMTYEGDYMDETDEMAYESDINENDLEITIAGLPDEVEADEVSVDVDDAEGDDDEGGDEGGDDLDLDFDDDDVVEIDENMLRQEVARMRRIHQRRLAEEHQPPPGGTAPGPNEYDDYGDADKEAETFEEYGDEDLNKLESVRRRRRRRIREMRARRQSRSGKAPQRRSRPRRRVNEAAKRNHQRVDELKQLRKHLAEANLFNAKMVYANKLLQHEGLNDKQKARIVESLDKAHTIREVKLLYRSMVTSITGGRKRVAEGKKHRKVLGSGSRTQRSGGASRKLTESKDNSGQIARWGQLAGIQEEAS